jgi:hypothetical protein
MGISTASTMNSSTSRIWVHDASLLSRTPSAAEIDNPDAQMPSNPASCTIFEESPLWASIKKLSSELSSKPRKRVLLRTPEVLGAEFHHVGDPFESSLQLELPVQLNDRRPKSHVILLCCDTADPHVIRFSVHLKAINSSHQSTQSRRASAVGRSALLSSRNWVTRWLATSLNQKLFFSCMPALVCQFLTKPLS